MIDESNLIFYNSPDGRVRVALMARDELTDLCNEIDR